MFTKDAKQNMIIMEIQYNLSEQYKTSPNSKRLKIIESTRFDAMVFDFMMSGKVLRFSQSDEMQNKRLLLRF
jgi:hypothetical protein